LCVKTISIDWVVQTFISPSSEGWEVDYQADPVSGETHCLVREQPSSAVLSHGRRGDGDHWGSFYTGTNTTREGSTPMTYSHSKVKYHCSGNLGEQKCSAHSSHLMEILNHTNEDVHRNISNSKTPENHLTFQQ
jgi:hypothetical protein